MSRYGKLGTGRIFSYVGIYENRKFCYDFQKATEYM